MIPFRPVLFWLVLSSLFLPLRPAAGQDAPADGWEGTLRQVEVGLHARTVRSLVGDQPPESVLDMNLGRIVSRARAGAIDAAGVERTTIEVKGRMARLGGSDRYAILDGAEEVLYEVDPRMEALLVVDLESLAAEPGKPPTAEDMGDGPSRRIEHLGTRTIHDRPAVGYRVETDATVAIAWFDDELSGATEFISRFAARLETWSAARGLGDGERRWRSIPKVHGLPIRVQILDKRAFERESRRITRPRPGPAYMITDFVSVDHEPVPDERFEIPEDYERQSMPGVLDFAAAMKRALQGLDDGGAVAETGEADDRPVSAGGGDRLQEPPTDRGRIVTVTATTGENGVRFSPADVSVQPGDHIRWIQGSDGFSCFIDIREPDVDGIGWTRARLGGPGSTHELRIDTRFEPGTTYTYGCRLMGGEAGTIDVTDVNE